ncbi:MAG: bifunctional response regulator/alkaline phosphatase family protein, partial [bacterium]
MEDKKSILWVDDEIDLLKPHIMFLKNKGYEITPVHNGIDAISLVQSQHFDLVFLDVDMPGKDGLETLEDIKMIYPEMPIVMITKSEEENIMDEAIGKKIDDYLIKPVNPKQILLCLKNLLEKKNIVASRASQNYIKEYARNQMISSSAPTFKDWLDIAGSMIKWDFEMEHLHDEGLLQTHQGQKMELNIEFGKFIEKNYPSWLKDKDPELTLSTDIISKYVFPRIKEGQKVYFVVIDCMRLDQWMILEEVVKETFNVKRELYYSILPTATPYSRNSLFSGLFPSEIADKFPDIWRKGVVDERSHNRYERQILAMHLKNLGMQFKDDPRYIKILDLAGSRELLRKVKQYEQDLLVSVVINFVDMLSHMRSENEILLELMPDESAYRSLTRSWFIHSNLYRILQEFAEQKCTIIITSDHGSILGLRGTELRGSKDVSKNLRYKYGENIACDTRHALFISHPELYKLPTYNSLNFFYIIAKENYYFVYPDKFQHYQRHYRNSFQHGGISMEEMI